MTCPDLPWLIVKNRSWFPSERNVAPFRYQWLFALSLNNDMQPLVGSVVNDVRRLVSLVDSGDGDFELRGQSLGQGLFHDPAQAAKPVQVICHLIVFDTPSVLRLITRHARVGCLCFAFRAVGCSDRTETS